MISPEADGRYRVMRSELIWLVELEFQFEKLKNIHIVKGAERKIFKSLSNPDEYFVRYLNSYCKLHSKEECQSLIDAGISGESYLVSNWLGVSSGEPKSLKKLVASPYIVIETRGK